MPGRLVDRETYRKRYEEEVQKDGVRVLPRRGAQGHGGMGVVVLVVLACAARLRAPRSRAACPIPR